MAEPTHQGFDIAGEPATHQGTRASCWDPACERVENCLDLDGIADISNRFSVILEGEVA